MDRTERIAAFLVDRHRLVLAAFVLLTLVCAGFLPRFQIDASAETLLTRGDRLYLQSRLTHHQFNPEEFILMAYKPHEQSIYSPAVQDSLRDMSRQIGTLPRVEKVVSILNVPLINRNTELGRDLDPERLTLENAGYTEEELRKIFDDHPVFSDLLVNRDQTVTALQIVFHDDPERTGLERRILALEQMWQDGSITDEDADILERLRDEAAVSETELRATRSAEIAHIYATIDPYRSEADIHLGGTHVLAEHLIDIIRRDLQVFGAVIVLFVAGLLFLMLRDWRWVVLPLLCCASSVVITMGLFGLLGWKTTVISANFIALQLILTLALVIHMAVHYQALARDAEGATHRELVKDTLRDKLKPSFYAGITTGVGFAALLFSGIQPVITFGWMMMVAMAVTISVSLALFPGILMFCRNTLPHRHSKLAQGIVQFFRRLGERRPWPIVAAWLVVLALSIGGIMRLEVENSFLNYFRDDTRVRQELVFIDRELGGSTPLDIVYTPDTRGPDALVLDAPTVQLLQRVQAGLEGSPAVGKVLSVVNFTTLARAINGDRPLTEYELDTLYTLLDRDLRQSLLGSYLDEESGAIRISARIQDSTEGLNRASFLRSLQDALDGIEEPRGEFVITNLFVLYQDILQRLYESQILTLGIVYVALGLLMMIAFRSVGVGLIALMPNVIATLFILGFMGWAGIPLDLMTITISVIAMGIAVDDTIHFIHQFQKEHVAGTQKAIEESFRKVGLAMLYTSTLVALGFSVLGFSDFVPGVYFGLLTALVMLVALLTDLTLLPVLLRKWHDWQAKEMIP